ncbi:hypothetical protein [Phyllobacterium endophyticum]|uniref:Uncharacterized protein n=1 Tax=Phyllobacterium endophyticum TaxID=1149773 RepID=A0A2P7AS22_9HYPH|nr:hypothetical protein [Phyllobacterium endophyticum]MBB3236740.1 hypothetical protein [Phyllobacterium endophyticum]PSH57022.1 hypothetical protein CU100_17240 [Phyllobacterium endophyticum]TYR39711.1 hypothetical protein FY050_21865 [Phyllobacterium endophyticum]
MPTAANITRDLNFADEFIMAQLVENPSGFQVDDAIVVNLSPRPMYVGGSGTVTSIVPAWRSTTLRGASILDAERAAILKMKKLTNLGGCMFRGWDWFGNRIRSFPRDTPLYISPQDTIGHVITDPYLFTNERHSIEREQRFELKLNLWWAPGTTDCFVHNEHPFLEVHTQIHGVGRMQKFWQRREETLYEDIVMSPGYTHEPFCRVAGSNEWEYPWHRYYADTDAVWLAIELHPQR